MKIINISLLFLLLLFAASGMANEDIFLMVEKGDVGSIRKILAENKDVNVKNVNQETPLHVAAKYGFTEIVELLVNASADIETRDVFGKTPLFNAFLIPVNNPEAFRADLLKDKLQAIKFLLSIGADVNTQDNKGITPLMYFSVVSRHVEGDLQFISQILEVFNDSNANCDAQDNEGTTALSWSASSGNENVVKWLLQNRVDVNLHDSNGMTALHWVGMNDNENIALMLIEAGADVNSKSMNGANALWHAAVAGNLEVIIALLKHGSEVNLYAEGMTPLHAATGLGVISINERLEGESFQEMIERLGFSEEHFLQMTKSLVEAGADIYAQSYPDDNKWYRALRNLTPFDYAQSIGNLEVANYLKIFMER